jgi:glycosyltransferase involved in cell wall biosynthesis
VRDGALDIWIIHTGEPLPIERPGMHAAALADLLAQRGHRILWWTTSFDHFSKQWTLPPGRRLPVGPNVEAFAINGLGYPSNTSFRRILDHRVVAHNWRRAARKEKRPHVMLAAMPPHDLAYQAIRFATEQRIPSIVNVRDPWPDALLDLVPRSVRPIARQMLWRDYRMLRCALLNSDSIVAVTDSLLEWALQQSKRPRSPNDQVIYTGARRRVPDQSSAVITSLNRQLTDAFVVTFVGTFGFYHAPTVAIEAARRLRNTNIQFVLAGAGELLGQLTQEAADLPNVHFPGWLSEPDTVALLQQSHVGICPATRSIQVLPNKAAVYFREGLPVVSAFDGDLRKLIDERKVGLNYRAGSVEEFAICIDRLRRDETLRREFSANARLLFREKFDAATNNERFADHIERVALLGAADSQRSASRVTSA